QGRRLVEVGAAPLRSRVERLRAGVERDVGVDEVGGRRRARSHDRVVAHHVVARSQGRELERAADGDDRAAAASLRRRARQDHRRATAGRDEEGSRQGRSRARSSLAGIRVEVVRQAMIQKLSSGAYRLYSRKKNPKTGKRRNLGTFKTLAAAKKHERAVQFF